MLFFMLVSARGLVAVTSLGNSVRRSMGFVAPDGVCAVYKPAGFTSFDVVHKLRSMLQREIRVTTGERKVKVKVGHGGTLDPSATGVLVIGVGKGCRELDSYLKGAKGYRASAVLGTETDTLDAEGNETSQADWSHVTRESMEKALCDFRGDILQTPPMFSALRKDGKRLYDLARKGVEVEREARPVSIYKLELTSFDPPYFGLEMECGGGTYVRSVISDLARHRLVESRAHMTQLERTKQGIFSLEHCLHQQDWTPQKIAAHVRECGRLLASSSSEQPEEERVASTT